MASANVVQFDPSSRRRDQVLLSKLDTPIDCVREKSQLMLAAFFRVFFESVDDLIFELADKAEDAEEQNAYFESMRSLRMQRNDMIQNIHQGVDHAFAQLVETESDHSNSNNNNAEHDAFCLSSIHDANIEEALALESFINKANVSHKVQVSHLCRRFSKVLHKPLASSSLPLNPESLCSLLSEQIQHSDFCSKAKLLVYSELENKLQGMLPAFYTSLNQILAEAGILPDLELKALKEDLGDSSKSALKKAPVKKQGFWAQDTVKSLDDRVATVIESLVHQDSQEGPIPTQTLLGLLTTAQHSTSYDSSMLGQKTSSVVAKIIKSHGATGRLSRTDSETTKLVGLMFECLFREHRLALPVKMQINRLQLTFIKVAIIDKSLFKSAKHPAKIFLTGLAKLGQALGREEKVFSKDSPLFEQLVQNVESIINEYDSDIGIFKRLNKQLSHISVPSQQSADSSVCDERARQEARSAVDALLSLTQKGKIPGVVSLFIDKVWQKVLIKTHMLHGSDSYQWATYVDTLEKLIWSVKNNGSAEHRQALIGALPELKKSLHEGLHIISYNPYEIAALLNSLSQLHLAKIRRTPADPESINDSPSASKTTETLKTKRVEARSKLVRESDPYINKVYSIRRGEVFNYKDKDGKTDYCCLAAAIKQSDAYIFVNRTGRKVVQYTAVQFAQALKDGTLTAQGQGMAFDSALERVVTGLRRPNAAADD